MFRILFPFLLFFNLLFGAVNINTASKQELMSVNGIGSKKADAIINYRNKNKFNSVDDIKKVKGIGNKLFNKIKSEIYVDTNKNIDVKK